MAKDILAPKAVSQNLMLENLTITDGVYGILSENDVRKQITNLSQKVGQGDDQQLSILISLGKQLEQLLQQQSRMKR
jgi:hypothetical protein